MTELILAQYTWKAKGQSEIVVEQRNLSNALPHGLNTKILVFPSSIIKCSNLLRENWQALMEGPRRGQDYSSINSKNWHVPLRTSQCRGNVVCVWKRCEVLQLEAEIPASWHSWHFLSNFDSPNMVMKDNRKSKSSVSILIRTLTFPYPSPLIRLVLLYLLVLYFTSKIDIKVLIGLHVFEFSVGFAWDLLSYEKENQTNLYLSFSQSSFYQSLLHEPTR